MENLEREISIETPVTNRGVKKPLKRVFSKVKNTDYETVIDWFQCTLKLVDKCPLDECNNSELFIRQELTKVLNHFGYDITEANHIETGINGYSDCYVLNQKMKFFVNYGSIEMGINIVFSGFACRELEDYYTWQHLFYIVNQYEHNINRIDIALDFYNLPFDLMKRVEKYIKRDDYVTAFKKVTSMYSHKANNYKESLGHSITFGSYSSNVEIQFYDKYKERNQASYDVDESVKTWIRCESRYRRENAVVIYNMLCENWDTFSYDHSNIVNNYLEFKNRDATRLTRCSTAEWWKHLLEITGKKKIVQKAKQSSIQKKRAWIDGQVAKSLAMLYVIDKQTGKQLQFINSVISDGLVKIAKNDVALVNEYLKSEGLDVTVDEQQLKTLAERMYKL